MLSPRPAGVDPTTPGSALQEALDARADQVAIADYWGWFTEDQLRDTDLMSPTVESVRAVIVQCAGS